MHYHQSNLFRLRYLHHWHLELAPLFNSNKLSETVVFVVATVVVVPLTVKLPVTVRLALAVTLLNLGTYCIHDISKVNAVTVLPPSLPLIIKSLSDTLVSKITSLDEL